MTMNLVPPIDLSDLSAGEFDARLGELVRASLLRSGACVVMSKGERQVTFLPPALLDDVPDDSIADALVHQWTDEEVIDLLAKRDARRLARGSR